MGVRMFRRGLALLAFTVLLIPALTFLPPVQPAAAAGTVGNGSPASCTEEALEDALAGGGLITFNCGGLLTDIEITSEKEITVDTRIEGDGLVRILTTHDTRAFFVDEGTTLEIDGMQFAGTGDGEGSQVIQSGAIEAQNANLVVTDSHFSSHAVSSSGGAVLVNGGNATFNNVDFVDNAADLGSGAIEGFRAMLTIRNSHFSANEAVNAGGALRLTGGAGDFVTTITDSTFIGNSALIGGAVSLGGTSTLSIDHSCFEDNSAQVGGAIRLGGNDAVISDSTFEGNSAELGDPADDPIRAGGAIQHIGGHATIQRSTFFDNHADDTGGAIHHSSFDGMETVNSTVSGNTADDGGAIFDDGSVSIVSSTIVNNAAEVGSALYILGVSEIEGSIVADNLFAATCVLDDSQGSGQLNSNGYNLTDDESCELGATGDRLVEDALLGDLADNGGLTQTHLPLAGSPAIDSGGNDCPVATDQRGISRPRGLGCEIGAVELVNQVDLCANRYNGELRVPRGNCASTEIALFLPEQAPLAVCVNRFNGDARYSRTGSCASTETLIEVQGDGSQAVCVNRFNGEVRVPRRAGQCASTEAAAMI